FFDRVGEASKSMMSTLKVHMHLDASFGYRTLCFAMKELPHDRYAKWSADCKQANLKIDERQKTIDGCSEEIESNLDLVEATAIEDKLQEFVPETIQALMAADADGRQTRDGDQ
ncbi:hypothetical protein PMAYCL1PPCAC_10489, partial [Pristionchus mayeri]